MPATLSLTLGAPATFGAFTPGVARDVLGVDDRQRHLDRGRRDALRRRPEQHGDRQARQRHVLAAAAAAGQRRRPFAPVGGSASPTTLKTWANPVSNDAVALAFRQAIGATDALRTGTYSKTLTFTLSTTTP